VARHERVIIASAIEHYGQALQFREQALALAARAFNTRSDILDDPEASPSVRLRAATFIIKTAIAPPIL